MSVYLTSIKLVSIGKEDYDEKIYMSDHLIHRLGIDQNQKLLICLGKKMKKVIVEVSNIPKDEIQLSESVLNEFLIGSYNGKLIAKHFKEKQLLYLGPIIALITEIQAPQENQESNFGSIHTFCKELHHITTKNGGFFYVFDYRDFSDSVNGYYLDDDKWIYSNLPMPDVIYNRIHSRRREQTHVFKTFRDTLEHYGIPIFNDRFLSKWEVYQHLMQESRIHPYMPETRLLTQENFYDLINQHDSVFIKPIHGSQGRNIIKLDTEDQYLLLQTSKTSLTGHHINKYLKHEVFYQLKPFLHNRIYIIQQGISLINFESKTMDFRVLVHKNQQNLWEVTSLVARISAEQQFVSNLARGGTIMKPLLALASCFSKTDALKLISMMKEISIETAEIISCNTNGITGELGIDIGVDYSGKPWIIEVNSKPSKNFEDSSLTKIRPSAKAIIQFCTKLALDGVLEMEE